MSGGLLGAALRIAAKDLRVEWRSREIVYTMVLFAALLAVVFSFAFLGDAAATADAAAGLLWVAVAFAGTIGLSRVYDREREREALSALLLGPAPRAAIFLGKLLAALLYLALAEAVLVPLLVALFGLHVAAPGRFAALLLLGTVGFASVGSLFAAALARARSRQVLLAVLTFPLVTPALAAAAKGTAALLVTPPDLAACGVWLQLLAAFDAVFVTLSLLVFGPLVAAD